VTATTAAPDPRLDLVLERIVDVPPELVWKAWTEPERIKKWFTPDPWRTVECEVDLRPGGIFRFVMRSPEGQDSPYLGCFLEVIANRKLVWTSALGPGFRPSKSSADFFPFTAVIAMEPHGTGTKYTALVLHGTEEDAKKHAGMGFHDGWGKALEQLVEHMKGRR
jgi:uncharacterized protein YndB with AHSA1/START domain